MTETIAFPIHGMTCASCVSRITRALRRIDGVVTARVDLATDSATVTFEPERVSAEEIGRAVVASGNEPEMDAARPVVDEPSASDGRRLRLPLPLAASVVCLSALGVAVAAGVPLGSLLPFAGMAACLGMHLLMGHGEHRA